MIPLRVLVTGGAGYVGSVVVEELLAAGAETVVVLDDLSTGHAPAVTSPARLVRGDIADAALVTSLCQKERLDAVVHMAGSSLVGESSVSPAKYYANNVTKGLALIDALVTSGVKRVVFSSSAAVYGEPASSPITEDLPTDPKNPYGETKLAIERALRWYGRAYGLRSYALRYFNAAGATERNGEQHAPETHLIPIVLAAASGERKSVTVFGDDYPTADGTCLRDYVHVSDLAQAHVRALEKLADQPGGELNLGSGSGYSVRQVIDVAARVTGKTIPVEQGPRRPGDPASLVASASRAERMLGWRAQRQDLGKIVEDAWRWLKAHPNGYRE